MTYRGQRTPMQRTHSDQDRRRAGYGDRSKRHYRGVLICFAKSEQDLPSPVARKASNDPVHLRRSEMRAGMSGIASVIQNGYLLFILF